VKESRKMKMKMMGCDHLYVFVCIAINSNNPPWLMKNVFHLSFFYLEEQCSCRIIAFCCAQIGFRFLQKSLYRLGKVGLGEVSLG
jgi:hypothetical protein